MNFNTTHIIVIISVLLVIWYLFVVSTRVEKFGACGCGSKRRQCPCGVGCKCGPNYRCDQDCTCTKANK